MILSYEELHAVNCPNQISVRVQSWNDVTILTNPFMEVVDRISVLDMWLNWSSLGLNEQGLP